MKKFLFTTSLCLTLLNTVQQTTADVTLAEKRLSQELAATVTEGTVVYLGEAEQQFLTIFTQAQTNKSRGGIILLHDLNNHADWPEVISPLRRELTRYGWSTLSIQLPESSATSALISKAKDPLLSGSTQPQSLEQEIARRIQTAIDYCRNQRIFNIVLLGHQFGAIIASRYAANSISQNNSISALVVLNVYSPMINSEIILNRDMLAKITTAFLEVVPDQSPNYVLELAEKRDVLMNKLGNDKYRQIHIVGADYTFSGAETTLASRIQGWLNKLAPSMEVQLTEPMEPATLTPKQATGEASNQRDSKSP